MYIRHYSDCFKIQAENGESIREQLGVGNGNCQQLSSALVVIEREGFSQPHFHKGLMLDLLETEHGCFSLSNVRCLYP